MKKIIFIFFGIVPILASAQQSLTLAECYSIAEKNYPLSKQVLLLKDKTDSEIRILEKENLPKLDINAQATYQSDVIEFPFQLPNSTLEPPNKDQYRATLDANQLIYSGGRIGASTKLKTAQLETQQQQVVVNLYTLKSRINQNYFSILLFQEQEKLLLSKMEVLNARQKEITTGVKYGAILPSSEQILSAEKLKLQQQIVQISFDRKKALSSLSLLINKKLSAETYLMEPKNLEVTEIGSNRPELKFFELQKAQLESSIEVLTKSNMPKLYGFAQAGYGNPGLNMLDNSFQDFYMVGLKMNWNIFDWGKIREEKKAADISAEIISTEKETFLLNNQMQQNEAESDIEKYEQMLIKDEAIIQLREEVLKATTSKLQNGAITPSEYITELNNLYEAKIDQQLRKIQLSLARANYHIIKGN